MTLPKSASAKLPARGRVEGTLDAFPFRAALESGGQGSRRLRFEKAIPGDAGNTVTVEITRVGDEPEVRAPLDLRRALASAPSARAAWADITPLARRDWILWITTAKRPETRRRRIENACDMLASGKRRVCCFGGMKWLTKNRSRRPL